MSLSQDLNNIRDRINELFGVLTRQNDFDSSVTEDDLYHFIGSDYEEYYKHKWFKDGVYGQRKLTSLNIGAFFFTFTWFYYRNMRTWGNLVMFAGILLIMKFELSVGLLICVFSGFFGNDLYYRFCVNCIKKIKNKHPNMHAEEHKMQLVNAPEGKPSILKVMMLRDLIVLAVMLLAFYWYLNFGR
ncbi:hypothetical protein [Acinetobacter sp. MD2(2019)]|uniref:hypothetical protein n=1 Tax=Acinetobacter sp. MD2(2019) TaxID=2605273 RepID=UPI002D1E5F27|nr:hypothetical protein [Acinetobacter sp. MD2(2019)]MEB3753745.1 hypothetical protein [Acinetobacter sp. MD2(2019)]